MGVIPLFDDSTRVSNVLSHILVRIATFKSEALGERNAIADADTKLNTPALHRLAHQTIREYNLELLDPERPVPVFDFWKPLSVREMLEYYEQK